MDARWRGRTTRLAPAYLAAVILLLGAAGVTQASSSDEPTRAAREEASPAPSNPTSLFGPSVRVWWEDGLNYEARRFQVLEPLDTPEFLRRTALRGRVNVRLDLDGAAFAGGRPGGDFENGVEIRRLQISTAGEVFLTFPVEYYVRFSLVNDQFFLEDTSVAVRPGFLVDRLEIGQFKPPQSLENLTSSQSTVFMERAAPVQALAPSSKSGIEGSGLAFGERLLWSLGAFSFGSASDTGEESPALARLIGRVSWATVMDSTSAHPRLLHLGMSGSFSVAPEENIRYRSRPESYLAPVVVDTGPLSARYAEVLGLEAAFVEGPWTVQAEYLQGTVEPVTGGALFFPSFYVLVSRFLTGESRPYSPVRGTFAAPRPRRPVFPDWGPGAWEVGLRFSYLDLESRDVRGGRLNSITLGVNWFLSSSVALRFNYVSAVVDGRGPAGQVSIFQARLGLAF